MTVGSLASHMSAQIADARRHPFPRVHRVPKKPGLASRLALEHGRGLRRPPAANASVPWQLAAWERRAPPTSIGRGGWSPGTPRKTPWASTKGARKSEHDGGCKVLWSRLGVEALSLVNGGGGRAGRAHLLRRGLRPAPGRARCPRKGNWPPPWPSLRGDRRPFAQTGLPALTGPPQPPPFLHI